MTTADTQWDRLLDIALQGLIGMTTDRVEAAERMLRDHSTLPAPVSAATLQRLRRTHAAAVKAAELWRGCVPQEGYGPEGQVHNEGVGTRLSVTG
jgi:hypothetical protein